MAAVELVKSMRGCQALHRLLLSCCKDARAEEDPSLVQEDQPVETNLRCIQQGGRLLRAALTGRVCIRQVAGQTGVQQAAGLRGIMTNNLQYAVPARNKEERQVAVSDIGRSSLIPEVSRQSFKLILCA